MINENNIVTFTGKIVFDPENKTKKHNAQASWKRVAMVVFEPNNKTVSDGITGYYAWFIKKRYNLTLNPPLRGAHITFINDRGSDMNGKWEEVKNKWDGKSIDIKVLIDPRTDDKHWWFIVPEEHRKGLHDIRAELGLGRPYFGLHMTIGHANEKNIYHSKYIHGLIKQGFIKFN
jgi:hypothetical protein